jgi:hypothetical protein
MISWKAKNKKDPPAGDRLAGYVLRRSRSQVPGSSKSKLNIELPEAIAQNRILPIASPVKIAAVYNIHPDYDMTFSNLYEIKFSGQIVGDAARI